MNPSLRVTDTQATTVQKIPGFEDMNLQVGTKLQLLVQRDGKPVKYFTSLIGYVVGEYLLARIPVEDGSPVTLEVGEKLVVKGFSGIRVFSFESSVTQQFLHPFSYAHLSFPLTVQSSTFRAAIRVRVEIPAQVYTSETNEEERTIPVMLTNLSADGALFEAKENIGELHGVVGLSFVFPAPSGDDEIRLTTKVTIRNVKQKRTVTPGGTSVFVYGVQFDRVNRTQQAGLQNFIYKTQEHKWFEDRPETLSKVSFALPIAA